MYLIFVNKSDSDSDSDSVSEMVLNQMYLGTL